MAHKQTQKCLHCLPSLLQDLQSVALQSNKNESDLMANIPKKKMQLATLMLKSLMFVATKKMLDVLYRDFSWF